MTIQPSPDSSSGSPMSRRALTTTELIDVLDPSAKGLTCRAISRHPHWYVPDRTSGSDGRREDIRVLNDSLLPKHAQLRAELLRTIESELQPGAMIPSERDLTTRYDVSRATVRAAISSLVNEGRLTTVPGRGTVVTRPRVESNLHLASFTQDMRRRGHRPSTEVLSSGL